MEERFNNTTETQPGNQESLERTGGDIVFPPRRTGRRWPCIAALLGFVMPGLGHLYAGRLKQGVAWYVIAFLSPLVLALAGMQFSFPGLIALMGLDLLVLAAVMLHGAAQARRIGVAELAPWQRWWVYALVMVMALVIGFVSELTVERKAMGIRAFGIPSISMEPGLLRGDYIMVNLRAYQHRTPDRRDVVVFKHPKQPDRFYIKRVVAVGGDAIAMKGRVLYIDGAPVEEPYAIYTEDGGARADRRDNDDFGPLTVPKGSLFVLGDNRDQSFDSRGWGMLEEKAVVGRALYLYWSWDSAEGRPRFERIGMTVR